MKNFDLVLLKIFKIAFLKIEHLFNNFTYPIKAKLIPIIVEKVQLIVTV